MTDDRHRFRLKGESAERIVHELAEASFFTDWCYRNPKLADGKELCDLLIVFEDIAVIWQIKDLKVQENGNYNPKDVDKNLRQLAGAKRRLLDESRPLKLSNPRRGDELFDPNVVQRIYLVSALTGPGEAYFPFFRQVKNGNAHVFTGEFLEIALGELNTTQDFVDYLEAKERFLCSDRRMIINGGEQELLATYLMRDRSFEDFKDATMVVIDEGCWEDLLQKPEYYARQEADEISFAWDELIENAHQSGNPDYERIAREMARPNRFRRRCLAKAFYDAHVLAHENQAQNVFRRVIPAEAITYCFLFMDDGISLEERRAALEALCFVARGTIRENPVVLGIATEQRFAPACSHDFCLLEMPTWTKELEERMKLIQAQTGLLMNARRTEFREDEYPS